MGVFPRDRALGIVESEPSRDGIAEEFCSGPEIVVIELVAAASEDNEANAQDRTCRRAGTAAAARPQARWARFWAPILAPTEANRVRLPDLTGNSTQSRTAAGIQVLVEAPEAGTLAAGEDCLDAGIAAGHF